MDEHSHGLQDIGTKTLTLDHLIRLHQEGGASEVWSLAALRQHHDNLHEQEHARQLEQERERLADMADRNPVWLAFKLLGGQVPPLEGNGPDDGRQSGVRAVGWAADRRVLSVYHFGGQPWMNLWLEAPNRDGEPYAESSNRAAAGTVILWANHDSTYRELARQGYLRRSPAMDDQQLPHVSDAKRASDEPSPELEVETLRARLKAAEAMIDLFPEALLDAGADKIIEEVWEGRIAKYRTTGTFSAPKDLYDLD